jgi:hypothetical protein
MNHVIVLLVVLLSTTQLPPKVGKIQSMSDPKANFASLATYTWERGDEAYDPTAHRAIVDAINAEMAARGFRLLPSGKGDVTVQYHTITRTDVDLDKLDETLRQNKPAPTQKLGRLVVQMRDASNRRIWAADTVQPLHSELAQVYKDIPSIVEQLFETYPGGKKSPQ